MIQTIKTKANESNTHTKKSIKAQWVNPVSDMKQNLVDQACEMLK